MAEFFRILILKGRMHMKLLKLRWLILLIALNGMAHAQAYLCGMTINFGVGGNMCPCTSTQTFLPMGVGGIAVRVEPAEAVTVQFMRVAVPVFLMLFMRNLLNRNL
jgi:hypothetical protein